MVSVLGNDDGSDGTASYKLLQKVADLTNTTLHLLGYFLIKGRILRVSNWYTLTQCKQNLPIIRGQRRASLLCLGPNKATSNSRN